MLSFAIIFSCIGYAQLSDVFSITGEADISPPNELLIVNVIPNTPGAVTNYTHGTIHSSSVDLSQSPDNKVSFTITVLNNTGYTYYFDEMVWTDEAYDNANIVPTLEGIEAKYELPDTETVTFTVTFSYKNASSTSNPVLNSIINYQFVPNVEDAGDIAVNNVLDKFKEILNDDTAGGPFDILIENMDDSGRRANETYIGNVVGADSEDTNAVNDLFTDELMNYLILQLGDGETKDVTIIVKREPLDGDDTTGTDIINSSGTVKTAGCEMTIYVTPDNIPADRLIFGNGGSKISVYAAVFTTDEDGNWYQLSPLYQGTATTNNYDGNSFYSTANSFNTDTWRSVAGTYTKEDGKSVTVTSGQTISTLVSDLVSK